MKKMPKPKCEECGKALRKGSLEGKAHWTCIKRLTACLAYTNKYRTVK